MFALLMGTLMACHTVEKIEGTAASSADPCSGPILVPQVGLSDDDREAADADQLTFTSTPEATDVRLSWAGDPSSTMSLLWRTDAGTLASRVQYGTDESYGSEAVGASFTIANDDGRVHETPICDLQPSTTYHYRVGGENHWSADATFTTGPAVGDDVPVTIAVAGDARDNQEVWAQEVEAIADLAPDFVIFSGDAVDFGSNMEEWDAWLAASAPIMGSTPIVMISGNHEFHTQNFYGLIAQPGDEVNFSLDYGPLHLAVLDDSTAELDREAIGQWLDGDLKATSQPWKIVSHHMPAYSSCTTHGSDEQLQQYWSPVEEANGVQLDITGHNHNYERSVPLVGGVEVADGAGTVYVVSAGAGADLYGNDMANAFTKVSALTEHYVVLSIEGGTLTETAYDLSGNVLDTTAIPQ